MQGSVWMAYGGFALCLLVCSGVIPLLLRAVHRLECRVARLEQRAERLHGWQDMLTRQVRWHQHEAPQIQEDPRD